MNRFTKEMGGVAIVADLNNKLASARAELDRLSQDDSKASEFRRRRRVEIVADLGDLTNEARTAFEGWAADAEREAHIELASDPVGSQAEETRKLRDEMRFDRLVSDARMSGMTRTAATDLAAKAETAYLDSNYSEAVLFGRAAVELGAASGGRFVDFAQQQIDLQIPSRASAIRTLREVERGQFVFERDANAALSGAFQSAAAAAKAVGDGEAESQMLSLSVGPSITAKMVAARIAIEDGKQYAEPHGTLPGGAMNFQNVPDGAQLPEPRKR